jgi:uncharacterized iron-regulated protein
LSCISRIRNERAPVFTATAAAVFASSMLAAQAGYTPERVFDANRNRFADFEVMLADLAGADVVLLGEQHDDPGTHRLEQAMLEGLARRRGDIVISLEMFERDVQAPLDDFLAGRTAEADFLKGARPWPRYASDYKPLVDFAIGQKWPVLAANTPRSIASAVAKAGLDAVASRPDAERAWAARDLQCPLDVPYFDRFLEAMGGHPAAGQHKNQDDAKAREARASSERYYLAQCVKDETMAESVARAAASGSAAGRRPLVIHVTGAFHSEFRQGTAERIARRLPKHRVASVSFLPVKELDRLPSPDKRERKRADYLVYTLASK